MKTGYVVMMLLIGTSIACKKEKAGSKIEKLQYQGSSQRLSEGKYGMEVVQMGSYTCFTRGDSTLLTTGGNISSNASRSIDIYNDITGNWQKYNVSLQRYGYKSGAAGNILLLAGGFLREQGNKRSKWVDIIDLQTGQMSIDSLSQPKDGHGVAALGSKILIAGGFTGIAYSNVVDIYDVLTKTWSTSSLSVARSYMASASAGSKAIFAGGEGVAGISNVVDIYDSKTNQWTTSTLSEARSGATIVATENKIFIAGGIRADFKYSDKVDVYDIKTSQWTVLTLEQNQITIRATINGNYVYFTSGSNRASSLTERIHSYDLRTDQLKTITLPVSRKNYALTSIDNLLLIAGGIGVDGITDKVVVYNTQSNSFDTSSFKLPNKCMFSTGASVYKKILVAGGLWDGTNAAGQREVFNYKSVSVFEIK